MVFDNYYFGTYWRYYQQYYQSQRKQYVSIAVSNKKLIRILFEEFSCFCHHYDWINSYDFMIIKKGFNNGY